MRACVQPDNDFSDCECTLAGQEVDMDMRSDVTVSRHFRLCVPASIAIVQVVLHCCDGCLMLCAGACGVTHTLYQRSGNKVAHVSSAAS